MQQQILLPFTNCIMSANLNALNEIDNNRSGERDDSDMISPLAHQFDTLAMLIYIAKFVQLVMFNNFSDQITRVENKNFTYLSRVQFNTVENLTSTNFITKNGYKIANSWKLIYFLSSSRKHRFSHLCYFVDWRCDSQSSEKICLVRALALSIHMEHDVQRSHNYTKGIDTTCNHYIT